MRYLSIVFIATLLIACDQPEAKEPVEYKGPLREVENMEMFYTENDRIKVKMQAAVVYEFLNGDREFPKGIYLEFYTEEGTLESTLKANNAYFFKEQNQWRGRGKVEVKNIAKNEQLNTEELFWKPADQKIFTEQFVTIKQQEDVIYGTGLDAKQDLSDYVITKPYGEVGFQEN
ncbi:LPS export ABC transporter periplasmic protein LptC [Fulvivirgaceae bacterium PWU37]|uniref:LPS export ABC transporter periplasmic protein LptC n=2 Tax=Dawidia soli TaxID=2782352 RepID=A0AAP2DG29_9BACT|nr:LPS export ABC transporter periplasmic protein LptC [Dawidia soli]